MNALEFTAEKNPNTEDATTNDAWMQSVAHEWNSELADAREDIYTLNDGEAIHDRRDLAGA